MGLLDWLTDGIGSAMGQGSPTPMGGGPMEPVAPAPPIPPVAPTPPMAMNDTPKTIFTPTPDPSTTDIGAGMQGAGPAAPPVPLPAPRPPGADAGPAALPPTAAPTSGTGMPPGPPISLAPSMPGPSASPLDRSIGFDPNTKKSFLASIGAGLTAAGNSAGKGKGQALFSGAGAAIEGGQKSDDKTLDQQSKYLRDAIAATQAGNTAEANKSLIQLRLSQIEKNKQDALDKADGTGKATGINTPAALYLSALQRTNSDPRLALLRDQVRSGNGPTDAADQMAKMHAQILQEHMATLGLNPKDAGKIAKQPGMSMDNPAKPTTMQDFQKLQPGQYYVNPANPDQLLIKMSPEELAAKKAAASGQPGGPAPAAAMTPAVQPTALDSTNTTDPEADKDNEE